MCKLCAKLSTIPSEFFIVKERCYTPQKWSCSIPELDFESSEYGGCNFIVDKLSIKFRVAKTTPTKTGQFVTLWNRSNDGPIQPFDTVDPIDLFLVVTKSESQLGVFIFPKQILAEKDVISRNGIGGKRAIRVYSPWDIVSSSQAQRTQKWQANYFLEISHSSTIDTKKLVRLHQRDGK